MKHSIDCIGFKLLRKGTLVGFADIVVRELKLTIRDVALHRKGESRWVSPPGRPWIKDGELIHEPDGRIKYAKILEFETSEVQQAFSAAVLDAYDIYRPP